MRVRRKVIDRHRIQLDGPIKDTGAHEVPIKFHADVVAKLNLNVKALKGCCRCGLESESRGREAGGYKAKVKAKHSEVTVPTIAFRNGAGNLSGSVFLLSLDHPMPSRNTTAPRIQ